MVHVRSDRWYDFPADRETVWESFTTTPRYRTWWPWLLEFDGDRLAAGERWWCVVSPPVPYVVRFTIHIEKVAAPDAVEATVHGDVEGVARLDLVDTTAAGDACRLHLVSDLAPGNPALRLIARAARPVVRRGHDWVLDTGARQFVDRALPRR